MVYTPIMRAFYRNKRRNEAPPHLYAVADGALQLLEMGKIETTVQIRLLIGVPWQITLFILSKDKVYKDVEAEI